jgi:folate-binding protein YgfZ
MSENWNTFLQQHGAHFCEGELTHFGQTASGTRWADGFVLPLLDQALIVASGDDAAPFLHNQLTNDVNQLTPDAVRLAGYCTPKGRLLATFLLWKNDSHYFLQMPRPLQATLAKRLAMFVMRSKVVLRAPEPEPVLLGIGGHAAKAALAPWFPQLPDTPYAKLDNGHGSLLRLADAFGAPRYQWQLDVALALEVWPQLAASLPAAAPALWHLADIYAGVPQVVAATQEQFVPQMINYELIGGVNFKKGCYPGQEIVARSQYLGKLKRRMYLAHVVTDGVQAGMELFSEQDPEQACGMVVNAAPDRVSANPGEFALLVEMKIALQDGPVCLGRIGGPLLRFATLPYSLE